MSDKIPFSAVLKSRDEALAVIEEYLATRDADVIAPYVRGMTAYDDEQTFAIMRGSGNEMSEFEKFLALACRRGFLSQQEAFTYSDHELVDERSPRS